MRSRVVPTGTVVSYTTSCPRCSPRPISRVAASSASKTGCESPSTTRGTTTTTTTSTPATADGVSSDAVRSPEATASESFSCKPGSPGKGSRPRLTQSTVSSSMSHPTTDIPFEAIWTARGSPIFPRPTTAAFTTRRPVPGCRALPSRGVDRRYAAPLCRRRATRVAPWDRPAPRP